MSREGPRAYRLRADEPPARGLKLVALGRIESAVARLDELAGPDQLGAAVHGARKDLKKIRALLRLAREPLGRERFRRENARYREAGRLLAPGRDADALLEALRSLDGLAPEEDLESIAAPLRRERAEALAAAGQARAAEVVEALLRGAEAIPSWPLDGAGDFLAGGLRKTYRRGRREMRRAREDPSAARIHEWRKRAKDHWYQLRLVAPAWPELLGPVADEAHRLAEELGDARDLGLLRERVAGRPAASIAVLAAIDARRVGLIGSAFERGQRLYAERPDAFGRRAGSYLRGWRRQGAAG